MNLNFKGFETFITEDGVQVELTLPEPLRGSFFAKLYSRGRMLDAAEGNPEAVWRDMSPTYGGAQLVAPNQVHGVHIIEANQQNALPKRPDADGILIKCNTSVLASLRFADCTPVVIAGYEIIPWMLLLHSGFKGTLQNIISAAMEEVFKIFPTQKRENIWAWIGPAIGPECYSRNIDDPSTQAALTKFSRANISERNEKIYLDNKGEAKNQLLGIGLACDKIYMYDCCTCCRNDLFYSYRAGDGTRRMFLLAGARLDNRRLAAAVL